MDEVIDLGMVSRGDERDGAIEEELDRASSPHWLAELWRADVLAVTAALAVLASLLSPPGVDWLNTLALYRPDELEYGWVFGPQLVLPAVAVAAGLTALRRAGHDGPAWVRIVSGAAASIGMVVMALVAGVWAFGPDPAALFS